MSKNQIFAIYEVPDVTNPTKLFHNEDSQILDLIKTLEIDGENVKEISEYYTFESEGLHTVQFVLDSELETMSNLFLDCYYLQEIDLSNLNTSKVTSMAELFKRCISLTTIEFGKMDTSKVTNMEKNVFGLW